MPAASKMAKSHMVKPAVDKILNAVSIELQAAILRAVTDHWSLTAARILAGIDMSKAIVAMKFLCEQSSRMMSCNQTMQNMHGNSTNKKRDAAKVMLTFSAPLPNSKSNAVPSICAWALILGMPFSTLQRAEKNVIEKHCKLTDSKFGVYWAIENWKKDQRQAETVVDCHF